MKKSVVIFDIDYTVFNTAAFRRNLYQHLAKQLGYSDVQQFNKLAKRIEQETKEKAGYFKPRVFLSLLQKKAKKDVVVKDLEKIFFDETLYIESLYEDSREIFQELAAREDIAIIIFSTGEKEFQMHKIETLKHMLQEDQIHIFSDKLLRLKDILLQYNNSHIYLVDDLPTILYEAKELDSDITTVWINREKKVHEKDFFYEHEGVEGFSADVTITKLNELTKYIK